MSRVNKMSDRQPEKGPRAGPPSASLRRDPAEARRAKAGGGVSFDVWGARGSRSLTPPRSRIANYTSCYSVHSGTDLFVLDGGRGLGALSHALRRERRFEGVSRIQLFLSHAHMDHWEGLKDANWFWEAANGLRVHVRGSEEALRAVENGYAHPAYVPLNVLAGHTLKTLQFSTVAANDDLGVDGWQVTSFPLNHYSGDGRKKNQLVTLGYRLRSPEGFTVAYLCDHEPTRKTRTVEARMLDGAQLAVVDAHFLDREQHAFGHGSQEHAAELARDHPDTLILAAHYGPTYSDGDIRGAYRRHSTNLRNFRLAVEGMRLKWSAKAGRFVKP